MAIGSGASDLETTVKLVLVGAFVGLAECVCVNVAVRREKLQQQERLKPFRQNRDPG